MTILFNLPRVHFDFGAVKALATELARLGIDRPLGRTERNLGECGGVAPEAIPVEPQLFRAPAHQDVAELAPQMPQRLAQ